MKDISSVLAMSSCETDPQDCSDLTLEVSCSPAAGMLLEDTQTSLDHTSTVSVMEWAECLIAMTISANDCDENTEDYITTSGNPSEREATHAGELQAPIMVVSPLSGLDENSLQNEQQQTNCESGSSAIHPTGLSLQGRLPAGETSCIATNSSEKDIASRISSCTDCNHLTFLTDKMVDDRHEPVPRSCVPSPVVSDILTCSCPHLLTVEDSRVRPQATVSDIYHGSQHQMHQLTSSSSDQFTILSPVFSHEVGLELGLPSTFTTSFTKPTNTHSSNTNTSLETPILEVCPGFTDTKTYSKPCRSVSNESDNCPNLYSLTESQLTDSVYYELLYDPSLDSMSPGHLWNSYATITGELSMSECDIGAVEVVSSDSGQDSTLHQSQDENSSQVIVNPDTLSNTELCQQDSIPCSVYQGNNVVDISVFTIEASDASTPNQSRLTEHCTEASTTHATSSNTIIANNLCQEFPTHLLVSYLAQDLSNSQAAKLLNIDLLSPGDCSVDLEPYCSRANSSRLLDADMSELSIENLNDYCSHSDTKTTSLSCDGEGPAIDASRSPPMIYSQSNVGNSVVPNQATYSRKRRLDETTTASQNPHKECTSFLSTNLDQRTKHVSKLEYQQKQPTQPSWAQKSPSVESTDVSLTSHFDYYSGNTSDDSSNTTHVFVSSASSSIQNKSETKSLLPQSSRYSPLLCQSPTEVTYDALLTPGDLYKTFLVYDAVVASESTQNNPHIYRKVSDASDVNVEDSDASNTLPTTPASCTDGEGSQGPLTADKVKDTLRSKLKAKQETVNCSSHTGSLSSEVNGRLSKTGTGRYSPPRDDVLLASLATRSSGQSMGLNSRPSPSSRQSPAFYVSQITFLFVYLTTIILVTVLLLHFLLLLLVLLLLSALLPLLFLQLRLLRLPQFHFL